MGGTAGWPGESTRGTGRAQAYVLTDERRWLWQGQLRIVAELDGDGELVKRFVYGTKVNVPEYMVTYDPVSHLETGTYRILTDQLGSLRLVVDASSGTVVQRMRHDEWGNVLEDTNPGFVPFGFAGGLYDPDTELVRFGARDYDPETGRWTGKDPILFGAGVANIFVYVECDPINVRDPEGLSGWDRLKDWVSSVAEGMVIPVDGGLRVVPDVKGSGQLPAIPKAPAPNKPDDSPLDPGRPQAPVEQCTFDDLGLGSGSANPQPTAPMDSKKKVWDDIDRNIIDKVNHIEDPLAPKIKNPR